MTIKENYEQYCNRAKEHLKIVTKNNITWDMSWLMFFKFNLEKFWDREKLDKWVEENQINTKYDFVDIRYGEPPYQVFYGNKLKDIHDGHTKSEYLKNMTFDLFGGRGNCFWPTPSVNGELFDDYLLGDISEEMFIKITMRNQQKYRF